MLLAKGMSTERSLAWCPELPAGCVVAMGPSGGAHHAARRLGPLGPDVRLIAGHVVTLYRMADKNAPILWAVSTLNVAFNPDYLPKRACGALRPETSASDLNQGTEHPIRHSAQNCSIDFGQLDAIDHHALG